MTRQLRRLAACLFLLGCTAAGVTACAEAACGDLGMCAASADGLPGDGGRDGGPQTPEESGTPVATNPYGVPYPTENQGWTARAPDSGTPGNIIPNVVFEHLMEDRRPNVTRDIRRAELAELYDPEARTHDVIVLILVTEWDANSTRLLNDIGAAPDKTVVLTDFGQGPVPGERPSLDEDFPRWANQYLWAWHAYDPNFVALAPISGPEVPRIALIDARTMELAYLKVQDVQDVTAAQIDAEIAKIRAR
jgi:hypothetical protein